jgi:hypothetical protein
MSPVRSRGDIRICGKVSTKTTTGVGKRVCKDDSMVRCTVMCICQACLQ